MDERRIQERARAFRRGDPEALRPLVEALSRPLMAVAYRYVRDWETARDLTQESWLTVARSIERWDPERSFRPWLWQIHRNGCLDHLRRNARRSEVALAEDSALVDPAPSPVEHAARGEFLRRLAGALDELSEMQRRVFTQVDLEQLDPREAALALDMHPTTLRTTLHFARRKLARLLGKESP